MLRRLPFVRPDFQDVRADDYPIRLWTVAVFLFGVLPVVRKRGLGRLVIGDEYDTTLNAVHRGIRHYGGLYDQSRYFDNAMSLYFRKKGWNLAQFSLLRPLSELLGLKVLLERYPELQRHQVSCHAASIRDDRVFPCGKCEKCRRVVSMLVALGGDPTRCGYTQEQVTRCVKDVMEKGGVHQEAPVAQHTLWLLSQGGYLGDEDAGPGQGLHANPEVMSLRFESQRSPVHGIPRSLRRPLYSLLLEHAEGCLLRSGRVWLPFDVFAPDFLSRPYRFEPPGVDGTRTDEGGGEKGLSTGARDYFWGELTWPDAERRLGEVDVAMLPVGAIEQHGPHLPLDTDTFDAEYLCHRVAERCREPRPMVLPSIPYGVSYHHQDFPGTVSVGPDTLSQLVYEVGMSAARNGINKLVIVNGHGGNMPALQFAAQMINRDAQIFTCVDTGETSDADVEKLTDTRPDLHAGEVETSTTLAIRPELVDMKKAKRFVPRFSSRYLDFSSEYGVEWYAHTSRISPSGVLGDPTRATPEKGMEFWEIMIGHMVTFVETLKSLTLAEIHQRRT
jgi:creatinine amidohydrolase/Fe(II)-dependent formamide hydrolase-like protein